MATKKEEIGLRISKIRDVFCNGKNKEFAQIVGISEQNASGYCSGKTNIGDVVIERILMAFPRINRVWLILGEGEMLKPEPQPQSDVVTNNAIVNNGIQAKEATMDDKYDRLIALLENRDRQIDRLLAILEKNNLTV